MSKTIALVGKSSTGKTTALRNLDPKQMMVVSPHKKNLPFRGAKENFTKAENGAGNFFLTDDITMLPKIAKKVSETRPEIKYLIFEDITHFFTGTTLGKKFLARNSGNDAFQRWAEFGAAVFQALCKDDYREDLWIISVFHTDEDKAKNGDMMKIKTPGSLLDRSVDLASYYEYCLYTHVEDVDPIDDSQKLGDRYKFVTNNDGFYPARTPMGLYEDEELYIPNDLKSVLERIDEFTG